MNKNVENCGEKYVEKWFRDETVILIHNQSSCIVGLIEFIRRAVWDQHQLECDECVYGANDNFKVFTKKFMIVSYRDCKRHARYGFTQQIV